MSTPLIILAAILAIFAMVLIPLMMVKGGQPQRLNQPHGGHGNQGKKSHKKKKKR